MSRIIICLLFCIGASSCSDGLVYKNSPKKNSTSSKDAGSTEEPGAIDLGDKAPTDPDTTQPSTEEPDDDTTQPGAESPYLVERRQAALQIIQNKCMACHTNGANGFPTVLDSDNAWVSKGLVVPGNAIVSDIINSLKASTSPYNVLRGNMPLNQPALSGPEIASLVDWINLMTRPHTKLFTIAPGTGANSWNSKDDPIEMEVGHTLRVRNNDSRGHQIFTKNNRPFGLGESIPSNSVRDHLAQNQADNVDGNDQINENISPGGINAKIYMIVSP